LNFPEQRNDFLGRRFKQVCVVHRPQLKSGSFDQLFMVKMTKLSIGQLVVAIVDGAQHSHLELLYLDANGFEHGPEIALCNLPSGCISFKHVLIYQFVDPVLI